MMKEYKLGENTILVVEVPYGVEQVWWLDTKCDALVLGEYGKYSPIAIPVGYQILGKASSITEEQAKGLVEKVMRGQHFQNYNYKSIVDRWVKTALDSFNSWLTANGIDRESLILKKE